MRLWILLPWWLFLVSCADVEEPLSAPAQGRLLRPARFDRVGHFVTMDRPNAAMYFVRDISPVLQPGGWRWTGKCPTLRFHVPPAKGLSFLIDFTIPDIEFRETGPLAITYRINGRVIVTRRYTVAGEQQFRWPVSAGLLGRDGQTTVSAEVDRTWRVSMDDRPAELGFILVRAGFVQ